VVSFQLITHMPSFSPPFMLYVLSISSSLIILRKEYRSWTCSLCSFLHPDTYHRQNDSLVYSHFYIIWQPTGRQKVLDCGNHFQNSKSS
jgi:hypothetical protein